MKVTIKADAGLMNPAFFEGIELPVEVEAHIITGINADHIMWVTGDALLAVGGQPWDQTKSGGIAGHLLYGFELDRAIEITDEMLAELGLQRVPIDYGEDGTMEA